MSDSEFRVILFSTTDSATISLVSLGNYEPPATHPHMLNSYTHVIILANNSGHGISYSAEHGSQKLYFYLFFYISKRSSLHEISLHTFFNLLSQGIKKEILVLDLLSPLNYENWTN